VHDDQYLVIFFGIYLDKYLGSKHREHVNIWSIVLKGIENAYEDTFIIILNRLITKLRLVSLQR
jgi:hypothetical protein